jgi:hypothetical protein
VNLKAVKGNTFLRLKYLKLSVVYSTISTVQYARLLTSRVRRT